MVRQRVAISAQYADRAGWRPFCDHSIFKGQRERYKDQRLGMLWVDAHPDLCDNLMAQNLSHACVLRRGN